MDEVTRTLVKTNYVRAQQFLSDPSRWVKGTYKKENGNTKCCLVGALRETQVDGDSYAQAYAYLKNYLSDEPENFNDKPDTQHGDVLNALAGANATL